MWTQTMIAKCLHSITKPTIMSLCTVYKVKDMKTWCAKVKVEELIDGAEIHTAMPQNLVESFSRSLEVITAKKD